MPRKVRAPRERRPAITPEWWAHFIDEPDLDEQGAEDLDIFLAHRRAEERDLWERHSAEVVTAFAECFPGRRPTHWWLWSAPRDSSRPKGIVLEPGVFCPSPLLRERLGGSGDDHRGYHHVRGLPDEWYDVDPANPPVYESEAAYLQRHGLLLPAEARRLRSADFEPERLELERVLVEAIDDLGHYVRGRMVPAEPARYQVRGFER